MRSDPSEFYRQIIDITKEGIWLFELDVPIPTDLPTDKQIKLAYEHGYLAECNDAMAGQYGFESVESLTGMRLGDFLVESDPKNYEFLKAFIESGYRLIEAESHEKDSEGNDRYFLNSFIGIVENGRLFRAWGLQRDVTAWKGIEKDTAHLAAIVESSDDAIISKDLNGIIRSWNKSAERIFGYHADEIIGESIAVLIPPDRLDEQAQILESIRQGESIDYFDTVRLCKDGTHLNVSLSVSPILNDGGEVIGASKIARDITDRIRIEEAQHESQLLLSMAMQSSRMGAWEHDRVTDIVYWSPELEKIFGLREGSFTGTRSAFYELICEVDREEVWSRVDQAVKEHRDYAIEFRFRHADGSVRWMEGRGKAIYSENGEAVKLYGIGIDITERKNVENALRASEQRFARFMHHLPGLAWIKDPEGRYIYANDAAEKAFRMPKADLYGKTDEEIFPDETAAQFKENDQQAVTSGTGVQVVETLEDETGVVRHSIVSKFPIVGPDEETVLIGGMAIDITDRKRAEEALVVAERRAADEYHAMLSRIVPLAEALGTARDLVTIYRAVREFIGNSMPCSAFFVSFFDPKTSLRTAAYAWGDEGEVDTSTLPPLELTKNGGPNSQAVFQRKSVIVNRYMDVMRNRPHIIVQENGIDPNSSIAVPMIVMDRVLGTFEVQAYEDNAFREEHVIVLEMVANLAAVAIENVRLIEAEARARQTAEASSRMKDEFLSVLSHELRTPLNAMLGWVRMLRDGVLDEDRSVKALEVIERNTRQQSTLIEDLLDVSRIISGKMRVDKEFVDIVPFFNAVAETVRPLALNKNVSFDVDTDNEPLFMNGDPVRLQQMITNLLQNSVKFTLPGGKIVFSFSRNGSAAIIKVKDTGIGIGTDFLPYIFDRFSQADGSAKRNYTGLGLGLTIVRTIVELHGGDIKVESDGHGKGSVFTVTLPLAEELYMEKVVGNGKRPRLDEGSALTGMNILLVDDDPESLLPLQIFLEREKADVSYVGSAAEALERLSTRDFHVLISDIGMPSIDGYEMISIVRRSQTLLNPQIPAIALTAYASADDRQRALAAGYHSHLAKPFEFDELLSMITKLSRSS
jgi:PAS domain S-box-containing protein